MTFKDYLANEGRKVRQKVILTRDSARASLRGRLPTPAKSVARAAAQDGIILIALQRETMRKEDSTSAFGCIRSIIDTK
jgi:hypothetical protein